MTRRSEAKAKTRALVLKGAKELFDLHGFDGVGIRDIARCIGMSTGAVFANFDTKEDLYVAATGKPTPNDQLASLPSLINATRVVRNRLMAFVGATAEMTDCAADVEAIKAVDAVVRRIEEPVA